MIIGVVGFGYVGRALAEGFRRRGYRVYVNDERQIGTEDVCTKKELVQNCDAIFVCVNTPAGVRGEIDLYNVNCAVDKLAFYAGNGRAKKPVIIIKSTVVPGTTKYYSYEYQHLEFACNPEFLRAETATKDFLDPDRIVIGTESSRAKEVLNEIYKAWPYTPKLFTDFHTAELIKYLSNAALVAKVAFACEVKRICSVVGCDAEVVMNGITLDRRINKSHLNPLLGPIPADSPCLPKDLQALLSHLKLLGYEPELLKMALKIGVDVNEQSVCSK